MVKLTPDGGVMKKVILFPFRADLVLYPFLRFYWVVLTKRLRVSYYHRYFGKVLLSQIGQV
jgi:hypothetical protein